MSDGPSDPQNLAPRPVEVGRYALFDKIATGGTATVHLARLRGDAGFAKIVAVKRLHAHLAKDREFVTSFIDEARLAARIHHPNVVEILDVVSTGSELLLVLDYVHGAAVSSIVRPGSPPAPPHVAAAIVVAALHGLHAAHVAVGDDGEPLNIIHRDISPQNVMVGIDGVARVLDFGIAKARGNTTNTETGIIKGKLPYMAPEHVRGNAELVSDVYAMGIVLWELLTGQRLFHAETEPKLILKILNPVVPAPSTIASACPAALDAVVTRALAKSPKARWPTARDMALAIEASIPLATQTEVAAWVSENAGVAIGGRLARIRAIERDERSSTGPTEESLVIIEEKLDIAETLPAAPRVSADAEPSVPARPSRRAGIPVLTAVVFGLAALAAAAFAAGRSGAPRAEAFAPTQSSTLASSAQSAAVNPAEPAGLAAPSTNAPPEPPASAGGAAISARPRPASPSPPRIPPREPPRVRDKQCDPPWTLDGEGNHRWKRECLH